MRIAYNIFAGRNTLYTRGIELTFKRHVLAPTTGPPLGGFFLGEVKMNIFIYSDESGVFDKEHNEYFVFGGIIFLSKEERDNRNRQYLNAERMIRNNLCVSKSKELKASFLSNKDKYKLYRSLNQTLKFGAVVDQKLILPQIFNDKKSKQRYLDFVFKISVKRALETLIRKGVVNPNEVENIYFFVDEHSTATNGIYELREAIEREFKLGTFNMEFDKHFPPLFEKVQSVNLEYCNSAVKPLVRASDIIANHLYHEIINNGGAWISPPKNFSITYFPSYTKRTRNTYD